jgi:sodium-dependent phosphate cotransporter
VFCSILTPLVGLQVIALERNYELTIGANIGTTITALLASLTQTGLYFRQSVQIALTHFLFNLSGCILWYVLPYFRRIPISLSRQIGQIVSEYRWFAIVYIATIFFLFPLIILLLALIYWLIAVLFLLILFLLIILILIIKYYQKTNPNRLPSILRSWTFLPRSFRSFSYWDHRLEILIKYICCQRCIQLIYPSDQMKKPLKEQYLSMKDQYLTALDHRYLLHTHQLNQLFEKHHAPIISIYETRHPIANYMQDFYCSLTGKPTQGQKALSTLIQKNFHEEEEEELIDRIFVFDRDKNKDIIVNKQNSFLSF